MECILGIILGNCLQNPYGQAVWEISFSPAIYLEAPSPPNMAKIHKLSERNSL